MINENDPVIGGGHYECSKCGEMIFGSALHHCSDKEIEIKFTPIKLKQENWQDILDEFAKFGKGKLGDWLIENFKTPERL